MRRLAPVLKLGTANPWSGYGTAVGVVVVSVLLSLLFGLLLRFAFDVPAAGLAEGMRYNQVLLWWPTIGLLVYAAQLIGAGTPLALGLGATRRAMWGGSLLLFGLMALLSALTVTVLLVVERATGGWFAGIPAADIALFGNGSLARAFGTALLLYLGGQLAGALFAAVWLRGGSVALTLSIIGAVLLAVTAGGWLGMSTAAGTAPAALLASPGAVAAAAATGLALLALLGWALYRRAPVR